MKPPDTLLVNLVSKSLPVWGAWIETFRTGTTPAIAFRRSPCGERGLKLPDELLSEISAGRSPCGERGLKRCFRQPTAPHKSRSPCGERGLKQVDTFQDSPCARSLPVWGAWIETCRPSTGIARHWSLPVWGAWIETASLALNQPEPGVAPRVGSVD